jgi:hypothetical protein
MQHNSSQLHKMTRPDAQPAVAHGEAVSAAIAGHPSRNTAARRRPAAAGVISNPKETQR